MTDAPSTVGERYPLLLRMGLVALSFTLALAASETALRLCVPDTHSPRQTNYGFLPGAERGAPYGFRPGGTATFAWDGDPYGTLPEGAKMQVRLNGAGLRGALPAPGQPSVLVIGDSFTFGEGVATSDTFVARLNTILNKGDRVLPSPIAINAGVPGYGTLEQRYRFRAWLGRFHPKAAVLVYVPNDPIPSAESGARRNDLMNRRAHPRSSLRLLSLVSQPREDDMTRRWYLSYYTGARQHRWAKAKAGISDMAKACDEHKIPFAVVYFPLLDDIGGTTCSQIGDLVAAAAAAAGARFLDLTPVLASGPTKRLWVHPTDHHPNATAHALVADALAPFVAEIVR